MAEIADLSNAIRLNESFGQYERTGDSAAKGSGRRREGSPGISRLPEDLLNHAAGLSSGSAGPSIGSTGLSRGSAGISRGSAGISSGSKDMCRRSENLFYG